MPPRRMTLGSRWAAAAVALGLALAGCGGPEVRPDEPTTAKEKQRREAVASGEVDMQGKWGGWRYQGDRGDCFFVLGRRCFKSQSAACKAAKCASPRACNIEGGGPATVSCK